MKRTAMVPADRMSNQWLQGSLGPTISGISLYEEVAMAANPHFYSQWSLKLGLLTLPWLLFACQAGNRLPSVPQHVPESQVRTDLSAIGMFDVTVDPAALTAQVEPSRLLAAQPPQALSYQIDISPFVKPVDFRITSVRRGPAGSLLLEWRHAHPFPAPNFEAPISGKNRADLGYTGYLVLISKDQIGTYDGQGVRNDGALLPDAYVEIEGLVPVPPQNFINPGDIFPAWLLVNEAYDSRTNVSNDDLMTGSYDGAGGGWQRSNIGAESIGWTGYDYLHGGQQTEGVLLLDNPGVAVPWTLSFALLAKWTDPRGEGGLTRRFPAESGDPLLFAYRLPYSALDVSQVIVPGMTEIGLNAGSTATFVTAIRDWDTFAQEAGDANLSDETDVQLVQPGASGVPIVEVYFDGLTATPQRLTHVAGDGGPLTPLRFSGTITSDFEVLIPSNAYGLLRVTDPEDNDPQAVNYRFGVEPGTLMPSADRAVPIRSYQLIKAGAGPDAGEVLLATATGTLLGGGSTGLVQLLPNRQEVPGSSGVVFGTAFADFVGPQARQLLLIGPAGDLNSLDRFTLPQSHPFRRIPRPLQDAFYLHPSMGALPSSGYPGAHPFLALEAGLAPELVVGDFLTGLKLGTFSGVPRGLPGLTIQGERLFADLAGPDWDPSRSDRAVISSGTGITATAALPPLRANGNLYTFNPQNPGSSFTKLTTIADTSTTRGVFYPDWSPDGTRLVCTYIDVNLLNLPRSFKLAFVNASSGALTEINLSGMGTPPAPATAYIPIQPVFNRTGRKVAFVALEADLSDITAPEIVDADIWVYDEDAPSSQLTNVSNTDNAFEGYPVFR